MFFFLLPSQTFLLCHACRLWSALDIHNKPSHPYRHLKRFSIHHAQALKTQLTNPNSAHLNEPNLQNLLKTTSALPPLVSSFPKTCSEVSRAYLPLRSSSQQKNMSKNNKGTNSSHNLKVSVNTTIKKDDKKNLYIETDFKGNKKFKKNTSVISNNKLNKNEKNKINNYSHNINKDKNKKIIIQNNYEDKDKDKEKDIQKYNDIENTAKTYNSNEQDKSRQKDKDIYNNLSIKSNLLYYNNNFKLSKNSSLGNITNNLNFNIFPLSRENTAYIKKKSSNINKYNDGCNNYISNTNRPSVIKHKKNYSISSSCYNTQRNSTSRMNAKSKNSNSGSLYSPKHNRAENKTIAMPEYKVKLERIKSRVISLLNVYSLLALKSANDNNGNDREIQEENINLEKNEIC